MAKRIDVICDDCKAMVSAQPPEGGFPPGSKVTCAACQERRKKGDAPRKGPAQPGLGLEPPKKKAPEPPPQPEPPAPEPPPPQDEPEPPAPPQEQAPPTTGTPVAGELVKRDALGLEQTPEKLLATLTLGRMGIHLDNFDALWKFAQVVTRSGLAPTGFKTIEQVFIAVQLGLELGIPPMSALQSIAVIKGKPGLYGDAALALVRASGKLEWVKEYYEGELIDEPGGKSILSPTSTRLAVCSTKRRGDPEPHTTVYSVADAVRAGLWNKRGQGGDPTPWVTSPDRMLKFRARGFELRDQFADVLRGVKTVEELQDYPDEPGGPEGHVPMPTRKATS